MIVSSFFIIDLMGFVFYTKIGSIISIGNLTTTNIIEATKKIRLRISIMNREDRIRTCDTLVPNQVLYQAELLPELNRKNAP